MLEGRQERGGGVWRAERPPVPVPMPAPAPLPQLEECKADTPRLVGLASSVADAVASARNALDADHVRTLREAIGTMQSALDDGVCVWGRSGPSGHTEGLRFVWALQRHACRGLCHTALVWGVVHSPLPGRIQSCR